MNFYKILTALAIVFPFVLQAQSPWVKNKKEGYAQLGYSSITNYSKLYFDGDDEVELSRDISEHSIQLYGEYGIADKLSLEFVLPFKSVSAGDPDPLFSQFVSSESNSGIGNIEFGVKRNFYNKSFLVTGMFHVRAQTNLADDNDQLRVGYESWGFRPGVSVGKGWNRFYVYGFSSFEYRTNNMSSILKVGGEAGVKLYKNIYLAQFVEWQGSMENGDGVVVDPINFTGLYVDDQEYFAGTIKLIVGVNDKIGGYLSSTNFNMTGNFVPRMGAIGAGLYYKW